ncbi:ACP S-malonyltransferase [Noviherbaspirillum saxi]|uniref:Malonate decarboxylase subunit epsilon n=1 Tax=Noviherbaspirillum saxi TaxID=2320863 RepID=A0A3A3FJ07_9BURK|nr:malonate decarboxylase subunit epsilon [Noviherbaspirillum saxi]RJF92368.1 malonate decarboxylase subunit epsilon [Noviherbaspirillum saxi]
MTSRFAVLCPGQGGQHSRMLQFIRDHNMESMFDQWDLDGHLGMKIDNALNDDSLLFSNRIAQPIIVAAQLATWSMLQDILPRPDLVAGYSIGELSAYGVAGIFSKGDTIALAAERARLMDSCLLESGPQAMLAISGIQVNRVIEFIGDRRLYIAIESSEDSMVVGGLRDDIPELIEWAQRSGARVSELPVAVASHTPLMRHATDEFGAAIKQYRLNTPQAPLVSGIWARVVQDKEELQGSLARQVSETIRWKECMDACAEAGMTVALELGPGTALSRMMHARHPHIECRSVSEFRTLDGVGAWIARHF